ncbi:MAG TPA: glutamyl-tRNA reductase [Acidimicrobiales bacterium]|nr:glutamyl-tRNA reductase [Acidimicrobiales bacterium]
MSVVVVVGLNHASASFDLLERVHIGTELQAKLLADLPNLPSIDETVVLATCQRTEIYIAAEWYHPAVDHVQATLADIAGVTVDDINNYGCAYHGDQALRHLFRVAAGLDSPVIGETEVFGQLRAAAATARAAGAIGPTLAAAFRKATSVARRSRSALAVGATAPRPSIATAAVAMASELLPDPAQARIAVLGRGDVASNVLDALVSAEPSRELAQFNRNQPKGGRVRARVTSYDLARLPERLAEFDAVFCCTSSDAAVVTEPMLLGALAERDARRLLLIDLAVPRDVAPTAREIEDVTLLDVRDVSRFAGERYAPLASAIAAAEDVVTDGVDEFLAAATGRTVAPLVTALRDKVEATRLAELDRAKGLVASLTDEQRGALDALTKALVAKVLHDPTVRLKDAAGSEAGDRLASSVRHLFDLDDH